MDEDGKFRADMDWCRNTFYSLRPDGGIWGIPACGLLFARSGSALVLTDRMPWIPGMPMSVRELREAQEEMYAETKRHFEAAGIPVMKVEGNGH